jgi:hypothetical protein
LADAVPYEVPTRAGRNGPAHTVVRNVARIIFSVRGGLGHESIAPLRQARVHATDITTVWKTDFSEFETTGGIRRVRHMCWPRSSVLDLLGPSFHVMMSSPS